MSQDKLDQFFRDKFSSTDPVLPSEGDWASAKALLDLEKKDDDRPLLWWLLLLSIVNLILVFVIDVPERSSNIPKTENVEQKPMANESFTSTAVEEGEDVPNSNITSGQASVTKGEISDAAAVAENTDRIESGTESDLVVKNLSSTRADAKDEKIQPTPTKATSRDQTNVDDVAISKPLDGQVGVLDDNAQKQTEPEGNETRELVENEQRANRENLLESLAILDTRSSILAHRYDLRRPQPNGSQPLMDRPKFRQTKLGWSGTLLLNPGSQTSDPVQGVRFGFLAEYYFAKNWLVGSRPSIQVNLNETGFSKFEVQTSFSFSAVNETYGLQASSLQFISLPIYLAWTAEKHTIELGGGVDWLIAARGQVQQVQIENKNVETLSALGNGWIDTDQMAQFSSKLFFGYKFAISYRLKAGMTLFYNPTNLYPGFDGRQFQHNRKWYMGIQANYYLN